MTVLDTRNITALRSRLDSAPGLVITCYCAAWCDTCRSYQDDFNALSEKWPQHTFIWIDIEDSPQLLDDHDVEDFPTILIQSERGNLFFGTQLPYISHLERLIRSVEGADAPVTPEGPRPLAQLLDADTGN